MSEEQLRQYARDLLVQVKQLSSASGSASMSPSASVSRVQSPSTTQRSFAELFEHQEGRDWNREFQEILDQITDDVILSEEKLFTQLSHLAADFTYTAKTLGRVIISEKYLPVEHKTIKPCALGGYAGGEKYVVHNIVFKFAVDDRSLYGSAEYAAKAAGYELKGLQSVYQCQQQQKTANRLHVPLCCLIDFRGFRLIAVSRLPINGHDTLCYGSCDGGRTIVNCDATMSRKFAKTATILNLEAHTVTDTSGRRVELCAPFDIEGHKGADGRHYVIDFARTFPCQPCDSPLLSGLKNAHLHQMLRPELVRSSPTPLSPDAFSTVPHTNGARQMESQRRIREVFQRMVREEVPGFAAFLSRHGVESEEFQNMTSHLHQHGINTRYLGLVRQHLTDEVQRRGVLVEVVARALKNMLRRRFRNKMRAVRFLSDYPFRACAVEFMNVVFGDTKDSTRFWKEDLRENLNERFPKCLAESENKPDVCLKDVLNREMPPNLNSLFIRFVKISGLFIESSIFRRIHRNDTSLFALKMPIEESHLEDIVEKVKEMPIVSYASGTALFIRARRLLREKNTKEARRLAELAKRQFHFALRANLNDYLTLCNAAFMHTSIFKDRTKSVAMLRRAVKANPTHTRSHYYLALELQHFKESRIEAEECFLEALRVSDFRHPNSLKDYARFLKFHRRDFAQSEKYYRMCISVKHDHQKALLQLAALLLEAEQVDYNETMELYLRAAQCACADEEEERKAKMRAVELLELRAECLIKRQGRERMAEAAQCFVVALALQPNHTELWYNYATFLARTVQALDEAEEMYRRLCEEAYQKNPSYTGAIIAYGDFLRNTRRLPKRAGHRFKNAVKVNPYCAKAHVSLADFYLNVEQDLRKARRHYEFAAEKCTPVSSYALLEYAKFAKNHLLDVPLFKSLTKEARRVNEEQKSRRDHRNHQCSRMRQGYVCVCNRREYQRVLNHASPFPGILPQHLTSFALKSQTAQSLLPASPCLAPTQHRATEHDYFPPLDDADVSSSPSPSLLPSPSPSSSLLLQSSSRRNHFARLMGDRDRDREEQQEELSFSPSSSVWSMLTPSSSHPAPSPEHSRSGADLLNPD